MSETQTLGDLHLWARRRLAEAGISDPALDARLLMEHITRTNRTDAVARPDRVIPAEAVAQVGAALARRAAGEPVHRILGFRDFYGLPLRLSADTLEPRADTETLVDALLPYVRASVERQGRCRILDLGTGTGAIALALLSQVPLASAVGTDIAPGALATAAGNAERLGLAARFRPLLSDWLSNVDGGFDVIASNPPYIESAAIAGLQREVREFDPVRALDGGRDGLDAYRSIASGAAEHLADHGVIGVEIGATQRAAVVALFEAADFSQADARKDLNGHDRALIFVKR